MHLIEISNTDRFLPGIKVIMSVENDTCHFGNVTRFVDVTVVLSVVQVLCLSKDAHRTQLYVNFINVVCP